MIGYGALDENNHAGYECTRSLQFVADRVPIVYRQIRLFPQNAT